MLCVELFVTVEGRLLVNEIAPRVHNSGHWTIEGCETSQFAQHIRAVCGLPMGCHRAARQRRREEPDRRRRRALAHARRRYGRAPPPLRQGGNPPRPQDGPRHLAVLPRCPAARAPLAPAGDEALTAARVAPLDQTIDAVMPGLVPGIHVLYLRCMHTDVDGRDKPGHDVVG